MASFHIIKIQYSKFLSYINIEGKKLCIFNVNKYYALLILCRKKNLYCSIHVAALIKRSLITLSEHILQMELFYFGVQVHNGFL